MNEEQKKEVKELSFGFVAAIVGSTLKYNQTYEETQKGMEEIYSDFEARLLTILIK